MIPRPRRVFQIILLSILIAALQHSRILVVAGIAPNLMLAFLVALAFFIDSFFVFLIISIVSGALIRFAPGFSAVSAAFILCAASVYWLRRRVVQPGLVAYCLTIGAASILFNALIMPAFVFRQPGLFLGEVVYTVISGTLLFELMKWARGLEEA